MQKVKNLKIPFNKPYMTGKEFDYIRDAHAKGHLSGDGSFTKKCQAWLEELTGCHKALLTHSCTAALEMAALLLDFKNGDEVIMPSYTFTSTANAFVLRGGVPVFVDIRRDTLNIDETLIEAAITPRTRAIVPVHYAGVACDMNAIMRIAQKNNLLVIEDAAQGVMSKYNGKPLGSIGHMAALSFHETKNIISGEGGALLVNDADYSERAEIIREKGTNRSQFFKGYVDKYTWVDIGSSYLPSELIAGFLWAQMEEADAITKRRLLIWQAYNNGFDALEKGGWCRRPVIPPHCTHNGHMYYLLMPDCITRNELLGYLKKRGIGAIFHYVPLHTSLAGEKYARVGTPLPITETVSECIIRLPLWIGIESFLPYILETIHKFFLRRGSNV